MTEIYVLISCFFILCIYCLSTQTSESNIDKFCLSPGIQNDLLNAYQTKCAMNILQKAKQSKYCSLIVDDSRDVSRAEQLSIYLKFTNELCRFEDVFLYFESVYIVQPKNIST